MMTQTTAPPPTMSTGRQAGYRRNEQLEQLLREINDNLGPAEDHISEQYARPRYPILLVVGGPRSGSTLMIGRKKPTRSIFRSNISITPKDITDFPLLASVPVI